MSGFQPWQDRGDPEAGVRALSLLQPTKSRGAMNESYDRLMTASFEHGEEAVKADPELAALRASDPELQAGLQADCVSVFTTWVRH
jgi:hypothetical protein